MTKLRYSVFGLLLLASPAMAMTEMECEKEWRFADINHNGLVTGDEAEIYFQNRTVLGYGDISHSDFMKNCLNGTLGKPNYGRGRLGQSSGEPRVLAEVRSDAGAPLPGINSATPLPGASSITESQAQMRIVEAGFTHVSDLNKDEQDVWRGTARKHGVAVTVAVDFKGNVVSH